MWIITAAYAFVLVVASVLPSGKDVLYNWDQGIAPSLQDALHVPAYAVLVVLMSASWTLPQKGGFRRLLLVLVAGCLLGVVLEVAQIWISGRGAALGDALMNVVGVLAGMACVAGWRVLANVRRASVREDLSAR